MARTGKEIPELTSTPEWREEMISARKRMGLTQADLGARVGTSQNIVSLIESGQVGSSSFIAPLCDVLHIPPPSHIKDEELRAWLEAGYLLKHRDETQFKLATALVKSLLSGLPDDKPEK